MDEYVCSYTLKHLGRFVVARKINYYPRWNSCDTEIKFFKMCETDEILRNYYLCPGRFSICYDAIIAILATKHPELFAHVIKSVMHMVDKIEAIQYNNHRYLAKQHNYISLRIYKNGTLRYSFEYNGEIDFAAYGFTKEFGIFVYRIENIN